MTKPPANVLDLPLEERAEMALKAAVEKVILESAREGLPIYVWRDGGVVEVSVEELCKWRLAGRRSRPESRHLWRERRRRRSVDQCRVRTPRVIYHPPFFDHGKPRKRLSNDQQLPVRWREVKKSLSNFPSPKTLRSSVNPKKGIKSTARSAIRERVPLRVPPPIAVMLSPKDRP